MEKQEKKDVEASKAEAARKRVAKAARAKRRQARRATLKAAGFRANRRMTKDKKTGTSLKGYFADGSATKSTQFGVTA
jgi:hypothetical protein